MVLSGFLLRVLCILVLRAWRYTDAHWHLFEMASLGYSLVTGHGFSSPFGGNTGPSAWTAPAYPFVVAAAFRVFGIGSYAAAFAILVFNSFFAALTSWTIYRIARRVFNPPVAAWSGWLWAVLPTSIYFSVFWIWETTLSTFLLSLLFMLTLQMENDARLRSWCGYGLLWGVTGLVNPSVLAWLPFSGCWLAWRLHRCGRRYVLPVAAGSMVFWITLAPWLARNYVVFGQPLIRGDFGVELHIGNNPEARGWWVPKYTCNNPVLYAQYKQMGEVAFDAEQGRLARDWIAEHPQEFLSLSLRRVWFFWIGIPYEGLEQTRRLVFLMWSLLSLGGLLLAIIRRLHGTFLFATLLIFYPLVYYFTFPNSRYRHVIEPELLVLAVFCVWSLFAPSRRAQAPAPEAARP
ncbi:MAG TPA: hypothetical protein VL240_03175 [Candidatus Binatia bacterium]|nr:hypothetical protein [Candidatus Binatia bacterium]